VSYVVVFVMCACGRQSALSGAGRLYFNEDAPRPVSYWRSLGSTTRWICGTVPRQHDEGLHCLYNSCVSGRPSPPARGASTTRRLRAWPKSTEEGVAASRHRQGVLFGWFFLGDGLEGPGRCGRVGDRPPIVAWAVDPPVADDPLAPETARNGRQHRAATGERISWASAVGVDDHAPRARGRPLRLLWTSGTIPPDRPMRITGEVLFLDVIPLMMVPRLSWRYILLR